MICRLSLKERIPRGIRLTSPPLNNLALKDLYVLQCI